MQLNRYNLYRSRLRKGRMNEFNCQLYIGAQAKFNPVLSRTSINKVAKFNTISYKELSEPALRGLLATFESIPKRLSV